MRILIATNRYFLSGGPERYLFNVSPALEERGHKIVPFALAYEKNIETPFARHFPRPPAGGDFVFFEDRPLSIGEKIRLARRVVFDREIYDSALDVIRREEIDLVYALQIAHYLYPEVILAARDARVPVLWRQSDHQLLCPAYNAFRDDEPCVLCDGGFRYALRHRCLKGSLSVTAARVLAMKYARRRGAEKSVARILCPSRFLVDRLKTAGFPADRLVHLPTPVPDDLLNASPAEAPEENAVLFVGGFFRAKGAHIALAAAAGRSWRLVLAGDAATPEGKKLVGQTEKSRAKNILFAGMKTGKELDRLFRRSKAVLVPSLWYENAPNVVLEAQARGIPVIASDIGSLPEMIRNEIDGLLVPPGSPEALARAVERLLSDGGLARDLAKNAKERVKKHHRMDRHLDRLDELFSEAGKDYKD